MVLPTVLALPAHARVRSLTVGCRAAVLDFVNRVSTSEDKAALASWLRGPYRELAVELAPVRTRRIETAGFMPGALARLLAGARSEVLGVLLGLREGGDGVAFGFEAMARGLAYRCVDVEGTTGWVPVAQPRMRLSDRVLALVAADYLCRPDDYESTLFECVRCEVVGFDARSAAHGVCSAHAQSDVRALVPMLEELTGVA